DDAGHPLGPELRRQVESELLPQARARVAEYRLDLTPADAIVTVDGRPAVITGGVLVLAPGAHTIGAAAPGHARLEQRIEARQGVQDVLRVRLTPDGTSTGAPARRRAVTRGPDEGLLGGGIASLV